MEFRRLGRTDIQVSLICLGTMTWGEQNSEAEAHAQLDYALDRGINFIDTAEMYPVPPRAETAGRTETYIGTWLKARKNRDKVVLATKVAGRGGGPRGSFGWLRGDGVEATDLSARQIRYAVEASLKKLQTDYIDLYQTHWPDRSTNNFGQASYVHREEEAVAIAETVETLAALVKEGKIRAYGVSNETPWGVMEHLRVAENNGLPRLASIQNPYNLLNRWYEVGLAEFAHREDVGLLAYSPLAMGVLSGKYLGGARPAGARLTLFTRFTRYSNPQVERATERYVALAQQHGLDPAQMALAYVNTRPFVTSNIIGATSMQQLKTDIDSIQVKLTQEVIDGIEAIHRDQPNPSA
ncbi:NADP(H)-dependent aldo-keto reductase [uncultured Ferrovibrio sp.]|jgi:aryl-alcohol dehydrogenase-like predicted oxidoreductase|uniref:NADP(H)-dependent aldo-keto reductase n=1 Tax=uncultured Ferrovibrio sp. TaxID=1576913 RepID=UPI00260EF86D|nr:NADP(H)-dependent aldo-keto reductase [uncultured Ferrovibrio sp.]